MNIRRNDNVVVLRGRDRGKQGKILQVLAGGERAVVEGVNLVTKHLKKSQDNPKGGIIKKEAAIAVSNLMVFCAQCKKGVRVKRSLEGGTRVRKCKRCGQSVEV